MHLRPTPFRRARRTCFCHTDILSSVCGIQKTLHQRRPSRAQDVYLTRGMILLYILYVHISIMCCRGRRRSISIIFGFFFCRLHLLFSARRMVLMGSSTSTARNSTAFEPFSRPICEDDAITTGRSSWSLPRTVYHLLRHSLRAGVHGVFTCVYNV